MTVLGSELYLEGDEAVDGDELVLMLNADVATKHEQHIRTDKCHITHVYTLCRHQLSTKHTLSAVNVGFCCSALTYVITCINSTQLNSTTTLKKREWFNKRKEA